MSNFGLAARCSECEELLEVVRKEEVWETKTLGRVWKGYVFYMKPCKCKGK